MFDVAATIRDNSPLPPPAGIFAPSRRATVLRLDGERAETCDDDVVEEVPVALAYNGIVHAVMLATPEHLTELALGFTLSEGIIDSADQLFDIDVQPGCDGIEVRMNIPLENFMALKGRRRSLASRSGCGICGTESLDGLARVRRPVARGAALSLTAVRRALDAFATGQLLRRLTGATHGVAWANAAGEILALREDVGRHNALDKLIGWLVATGIDPGDGFALTSSRASYEMAQKTAAAGIGCLVAISAPTGMAVRLADASNLTLAGFARGQRLVVYSHPDHFSAA